MFFNSVIYSFVLFICLFFLLFFPCNFLLFYDYFFYSVCFRTLFSWLGYPLVWLADSFCFLNGFSCNLFHSLPFPFILASAFKVITRVFVRMIKKDKVLSESLTYFLILYGVIKIFFPFITFNQMRNKLKRICCQIYTSLLT